VSNVTYLPPWERRSRGATCLLLRAMIDKEPAREAITPLSFGKMSAAYDGPRHVDRTAVSRGLILRANRTPCVLKKQAPGPRLLIVFSGSLCPSRMRFACRIRLRRAGLAINPGHDRVSGSSHVGWLASGIVSWFAGVGQNPASEK